MASARLRLSVYANLTKTTAEGASVQALVVAGAAVFAQLESPAKRAYPLWPGKCLRNWILRLSSTDARSCMGSP